MKTKKSNRSTLPKARDLGTGGLGSNKQNSYKARKRSHKNFTQTYGKNKTIFKREIELFLEKKLDLEYNELQFKIKEIDQSWIIIEIVEPVHHEKGIPIKEFQKFLLEELGGGSSDR